MFQLKDYSTYFEAIINPMPKFDKYITNEKHTHTSQYNFVCQYVNLNPEIHKKHSMLSPH